MINNSIIMTIINIILMISSFLNAFENNQKKQKTKYQILELKLTFV